MKYILTCIAFAICLSVSAQKLYLHDMQSGNYKSYDIGDKIEFIIKDQEGSVNGVITSFQKDGFTLNDSIKVKLSEIAALAKAGASYTVGRVLMIILGGYVMFIGVVYTVVGVVFTIYSPPAGIIIAAFSAGIGYGGYSIIKRQVQKARTKTIERQEIDNVHYRLIIE